MKPVPLLGFQIIYWIVPSSDRITGWCGPYGLFLYYFNIALSVSLSIFRSSFILFMSNWHFKYGPVMCNWTTTKGSLLSRHLARNQSESVLYFYIFHWHSYSLPNKSQLSNNNIDSRTSPRKCVVNRKWGNTWCRELAPCAPGTFSRCSCSTASTWRIRRGRRWPSSCRCSTTPSSGQVRRGPMLIRHESGRILLSELLSIY